MSLTKDDLQQIKAVVKEGFAEEFPKAFEQAFPSAFDQAFPKAFEKEYPRLRKEMNLVFAEGINELILPQFDEMRKRFDEMNERFSAIGYWQEHTDEILGSFYSEMKSGLRFLKDRSEQSFYFTDDVDIDAKEMIGKHYRDFEKNYVKKEDHQKLKRRVKKLELTRS